MEWQPRGPCPWPGPADTPAVFQNEITHDEHCATCKRGANLQPCGACPGAYHLSCLDPPLRTAPKGVWVCPRCQQKVRAGPRLFPLCFWAVPAVGGDGGGAEEG